MTGHPRRWSRRTTPFPRSPPTKRHTRAVRAAPSGGKRQAPAPLSDLGGASRLTAGAVTERSEGKRSEATLTARPPAPPSSRSKGGGRVTQLRMRSAVPTENPEQPVFASPARGRGCKGGEPAPRVRPNRTPRTAADAGQRCPPRGPRRRYLGCSDAGGRTRRTVASLRSHSPHRLTGSPTGRSPGGDAWHAWRAR